MNHVFINCLPPSHLGQFLVERRVSANRIERTLCDRERAARALATAGASLWVGRCGGWVKST